MTLGKFRSVNLADVTWNLEKELMCPNNPIGHVEVYLTSHHGIEQSGSPALVHGLTPQVAIMHNSTRKGGVVQTMDILHRSPGLEDIWQLHWAYAAGLEQNSPGLYIANIEEPATLAAQLTGGGRGAGGAQAGGPPWVDLPLVGPPMGGAPGGFGMAADAVANTPARRSTSRSRPMPTDRSRSPIHGTISARRIRHGRSARENVNPRIVPSHRWAC